jgi:hypothetical protein
LVWFLSLLLLLSCSSKSFEDVSKKWDYQTREWFKRGEGSEEFKVLLKDKECYRRLKGRFEVTSSFPSTVITVRLTKEELVRLSEDECVIFVSFPKPVHPKF